MGLIPEDKIAEIRDRTDIVQVIGEYVSLKRSGINHKGLCPFHQEKSPSFNVNAQKQFFHCFGCGKSGDVYSFLTEVEGKPFVEVARELARKAGIEIPEQPKSREQQERARVEETERARMIRLNELVANWFRAQLDAPVGEHARAYLAKRAIGGDIAEKFRVGYAPAGWEALTRFLESKKVPHELAERAGLVRRRESAKMQPAAPPSKATHFDVFVDRVVYALTSPMGEVIGFGGRILDGAATDQPKYKNSPETLIYKKGENLFGLHTAKHAIRKSGRALVVEGNFDVMTLHQHGVDYTVAPQGTAITDAQVSLLKRFAREVVLMLDADPAGRAATMKVIGRFVDADLKARVASLRAKDGKKVDPDDLARNDLPRLQAMIDHATDALEFFFDQVAATSAPSVPGKVAAVEECAPLLRAIRDPLARDLYLNRLATLLNIDSNLVRRALRGGREAGPPPRELRNANAVPMAAERAPQSGGDGGYGDAPEAAPIVKRPIERSHEELLAFLGQHATLIARMSPDVVSAISDPDVRALVAAAREKGAFDPRAAVESAAPAIRDAVARAAFDERFAGIEPAQQERTLADLEQRLRLDATTDLEQARREALAKNDMDAFHVLTARIRQRRRTGESPR